MFLTDQMGIAAGAVSFLTLFVRIFDGINDPIIGSMADRSVDKGKGKYKPWVRWGALAKPFPSSPCSPCRLPGATPSR